MGLYVVVGHAMATARRFWVGAGQSRRLQVAQECRYGGKRVVRRLTPEGLEGRSSGAAPGGR